MIDLKREAFLALERLVNIGVTGIEGEPEQSRIVANCLLSLYNGSRFKVDLSYLRVLPKKILEDVMTVILADARRIYSAEIHSYFDDGSTLFEMMAVRWRIKDHCRGGNEE